MSWWQFSSLLELEVFGHDLWSWLDKLSNITAGFVPLCHQLWLPNAADGLCHVSAGFLLPTHQLWLIHLYAYILFIGFFLENLEKTRPEVYSSSSSISYSVSQ